MTPKIFEGPDLLLWDRAKRFGVNSPEWREELRRAQLLSKPRNKKQERYWILSVLNEIGPDEVRLRCLKEYMDFLLGPQKVGKRASPETLERARKIFWALEKIRKSEGGPIKSGGRKRRKDGRATDAIGKLADEPWRYALDSEIPQRKGIERLDALYRHFWGIKRKRILFKKRQERNLNPENESEFPREGLERRESEHARRTRQRRLQN